MLGLQSMRPEKLKVGYFPTNTIPPTENWDNEIAKNHGVVEEDDFIPPSELSLMKKALQTKLNKSPTDIVDILRKDPKSPLYAVRSFQELNLRADLLKGVYGMGFNNPSKIQETALPTLMADPPQNMIAQAQNGTGKSAAFIISALSRINKNEKYPQVLVLSPTYELAHQTGQVAKTMAKYSPDITFKIAVRGEAVARGSQITDQFVVGTPGKVLDWALRYKVFDIKKIKVFVLDEADVMISQQGHQGQSIRIHRELSETCQMMLFSATFNEEIHEFAEAIIANAVVIRLRREEESLPNIGQYYVRCVNEEEKYRALSNIYGVISIGQTIIFCRTRRTSAWLVSQLSKDGHHVSLLSGELTVEQRVAVLQRFRDGKERVMVTTNVCARGIDIEQVTLVVNFEVPVLFNGSGADYETYLHRIGRTGRFGKHGVAINMIDSDESLTLLMDIAKHFGRKTLPLDANDVDAIECIGIQ